MEAIELFVGAGGLALGTARAGFRHCVVIDNDNNVRETITRNKARRVKHVRDWDLFDESVGRYDFLQHRDAIDIITGGPPCQPFSLGGKHLGHEDHRNLFPVAVKAIRQIRPKAFIFENVKGLLRPGFSNYYDYIIHQMRMPTILRREDEEWTDHSARLERARTSASRLALRYNVVPKVLNAADYGVPQRRERVFIVGIRSDLGIKFSFPEPTHEENALLHDKWVTGAYWERHRIPRKKRPLLPESLERRVAGLHWLMPNMMLKPWRTVRDAISDLPRISIGQTSSKIANHFFNPGARSYKGHTGSPLDEPAKTLKAGDHGVPGGENTLRLEDDSVRYFSVRECARLQSFPDQWVFGGSWTECMRQLGNAVPVVLAEAVGRELAKVLSTAPVDSR